MFLLNMYHKVTNSSQLEFYRLISKIATMFAYVQQENYEDSINDALKSLAEFVKADRVYIFQYDFENNTCSNTFEYCRRAISSEITNLQDVPLEGIMDWVGAHQTGEALYIPDVGKLLKTNRVREILEPQGVKSLITIPLYMQEELYGFLGFDSVLYKRKYTKFEQSLLQEFSSLLIGVIKRIEMERKLEKEKQKIEYIIEAADLGVWEWDCETNHVKYNQKWADMVGYKLDELNPNLDTWKNLTNPQDLAISINKVQSLIRDESNKYVSEFRMKHKDGHTVWIKDSGKIIERKNGKPKVLLGAHIDISEIKQQQQQLQIITKAMEYSPAAVVITNEFAEIEFVNTKFTEMTGYSIEDVKGKNPKVLKSGMHDLQFYSNMWHVLTCGKSWRGEFYNKRKNGETYWESALIAPVQDSKMKTTHYIAIKTDITEKKNQELMLQQQRMQLEKDIKSKVDEADSAQKAAIIALAKLTEARDYGTGKHVERVQHLCKVLATELMRTDQYQHYIDSAYLEDIFFASALHDIGKINIPDCILLKPSKLSEDEFDIMKNHVNIGAEILSEMVRQAPSRKIIMSARIAKYHHERWDGTGYVKKLKGENIPLEARIMSLVDVYDALRSSRPYKIEYPHTKTMEIIIDESGKQFDPDIVSAFLRINTQFEVIFDSFV
ncbi:MAG: PAS domain S-box protein [Tissierellales bacterium]|nr:PAS domain S-box protein [Tissierellales bacterium]